MLIHVGNAENFAQVINGKQEIALVDFWAPWCGPCKMLGPVVEALAAEHPELVVAKVDVDQVEELAAQYGIQNIPTIIIFKAGQEVNRLVGLRSKAELLEAVQAVK